MSASTIPAAYSALLAACQAVAVANPGWNLQVADGTPVAYAANTYIVLEGVAGGIAPWESTRFAQLESYTVHGLVRCWVGDTDPVTARATTFQVLDALKAQLLADLDAGPLAWNGSASWRLEANDLVQGPTSEGGWACETSFAVHITTAYLEAS